MPPSDAGTTYRVSLEQRAQRDADSIYLYLAEDSPEGALRWYDGLIEQLGSLAQMPYRFQVHELDEVLRVGLRRILYGQYLAFYTVSDITRTVHILHIRHGARRPLASLDDVDSAPTA